MLTISKPLSAAQARTYHAEEFSSARDNYYTMGDQVAGQWHGRLAEQWGLRGEVNEAHFQRLADGRHPLTDEPLVRHQTACQYTNARGERVKAMEHRAGWDATFSAPKSVSLTALVGGDERVREAHRASVTVALDEVERYVQARLGGNLPAETTGPLGRREVRARQRAARRGIRRAPAPHARRLLQSHGTPRAARSVRCSRGSSIGRSSTGPRSIAPSWPCASPASGTRLSAARVDNRKSEATRRRIWRPRARAVSRSRRTWSSTSATAPAPPRSPRTRRGKRSSTARTTRCSARIGRWRRPSAISPRTSSGRPRSESSCARIRRLASRARTAVTFGKERNLEREAVVDERAVLRDALTRSMGEVAVGDIQAEFEQRVEAGEFIGVAQAPGAAGRAFTTREMLDLERDVIDMMRAGQHSQSAFREVTATDLAKDAPGSDRTPARRGLADPREPRPDDGVGRRRRRRENDGPRGRPCRGRAWRLPRRRVRADLPRGAEAERGRHRVDDVAAAPDQPRGSAGRPEAALRPRRIESGEHEADARIPSPLAPNGPRAPGR